MVLFNKFVFMSKSKLRSKVKDMLLFEADSPELSGAKIDETLNKLIG